MLGCVGSRDKAQPPSSVEPFAVRGLARSPETVTFEFGLQANGREVLIIESITVCVQRLEVGSFSSSWVPVPSVKWSVLTGAMRASATLSEGAEAAEKASDGSGPRKPPPLRCEALVMGLSPERDYTFRLLAKGRPQEQFSNSRAFLCRTSDRPTIVEVHLVCKRRWAHSLEIEWLVADPDGAAIDECVAQCRPDSLMSGWLPETSLLPSADHDLADGTAAPPGYRRWLGRIGGLEGATAYRLHARARNAVGWSPTHSPELFSCTSDLPLAPTGLALLRRHPDCVTVGFSVEDPEGAPVEDCHVQLKGSLGYATHPHSRFLRLPAEERENSRRSTGPKPALCIIEGLQHETDYQIRLLVQNAAGTARNASVPLQVATSERPRPPVELCVRVGPRTIEAEWQLQDPIGAPLTACELEYSADSVFGAWKTVEAEVVAFATSGGREAATDCDNDGRTTAAMVAAVSVIEATAATTMVRMWRAQLQGLERETAYVLRARARNSIGWSTAYSPTVRACTSDRPPAPHTVQMVARLPAAVKLEVAVAEVLGTAPVSQLHVEKSGNLSWQDVKDIEVLKLDPPHEARKDQVSWWSVTVILGIDPTTTHKLRVWASNAFGRCSEPSEICSCRTSDQPSPPSAWVCRKRLPHGLVLDWQLPEPEGAPVWRFEVQCRRDTSLASWQTAVCADTVPCGDTPGSWQCSLEQLEPATAYRVCARACNEVGWSDWHSSEVSYETSSLPKPPEGIQVRCAVDESPLSSGDPAKTQGCLVVDLTVTDPEGAPVVACMVRCSSKGLWSLARRVDRSKPGRWIAPIPTEVLPESKATLTVSVRCANAVGWGKIHEETAELPALASASPWLLRVPDQLGSVELVFEEVQQALAEQKALQQRLGRLSSDAMGRSDQEHSALLSWRYSQAEKRAEVLEEVAQQVSAALATGVEDQGARLVAQLQEAMQRPRLVPNPPAAAHVLSLLLNGYLWLETRWRSELRLLSDGVAKAMDSVAGVAGGRMLLHWAKQHQSWSESFDAQVSDTLPEGLATAAQLLTTLAGGRKLELFEAVRADLKSCLTLVAAAERQLKRLRTSHRVLHAAEAASCHDFERRGILQKIETTALGLVTMLVLPVPGSIEVGTVGIGMLWLEGDAAGSHLALQHPPGVPLAPVLQRLGSSPPPRAAVILAGWASGGHKGVVLVHNATARRITVSAGRDPGFSLASTAYRKLSEAHPMVRVVGSAMSETNGGDHVATVLPTDVVLIQVPDVEFDRPIRLEFAYGPATKVEKAVGWTSVRQGSAVSFIHLDSSLQVSNLEDQNSSVEEGTIKVVNNDLAPVAVNVFRAPEVQKHFESALLAETMQSGEGKALPLPRPCDGRIFQVEVRHDGGKRALCEARPGQSITVESIA